MEDRAFVCVLSLVYDVLFSSAGVLEQGPWISDTF